MSLKKGYPHLKNNLIVPGLKLGKLNAIYQSMLSKNIKKSVAVLNMSVQGQQKSNICNIDEICHLK